MHAKGELLDKIDPGGTAVLNADDPLVLRLAQKSNCEVLLFGVAAQADIRAESIDAGTRLPAIGQGIIGIETRLDDARVGELLAPLHDEDTAVRLAAERSLNATLAGGCQAPVAGHAVLQGSELRLRGLVGWPDGSTIVQGEVSGPAGDAVSLGRTLAEDLLERGARPILETLLADT